MIVVFAIASRAFGEDTNVQSLSEGACWYEQGEMVKIASFNDRESALISRDEIEMQVEGLLSGKKNKAITSDLTLHCGGYGSSLVIKSEMDGKPICLWVKFNKGKLAVRSLGGLESSKVDVCDGYKWGELIVGLKSIDQKALLESGHFHGMIKSVSVISGTTLKIVLDESYVGKEVDAMAELKKQIELRYIELNLYQHPVGEAAAIK
ncbi:MAG: hypothetical protein H7177_11130 [Rhizobacter sp.]|nr:hypothetical protein [Bacteriovorax sp.]